MSQTLTSRPAPGRQGDLRACARNEVRVTLRECDARRHVQVLKLRSAAKAVEEVGGPGSETLREMLRLLAAAIHAGLPRETVIDRHRNALAAAVRWDEHQAELQRREARGTRP